MARPGLDKNEVKKASELLVAQGRYPSADAVRVVLGNTGSKSTIHKYLKELEQEAGNVSARQTRTARTLHDVVEDLAAQLHAEADVRIAELRAEQEAVLRRNAEEMAAMQKQIESLKFQLEAVEAIARSVDWAHENEMKARAHADKPAGFGLFGALVGSSRNSKQGWSKLNIFSSRSNADEPAFRGGYDQFSSI